MAEARLLAGRTGYDVVVHAERYSARLIPIGVYRPLDESKLTELAEPRSVGAEDAASRPIPGNRYGVPYLWGTTGFTYNVKMITRAHAQCAGRQRRHDLQAGGRAALRRLRHHASSTSRPT